MSKATRVRLGAIFVALALVLTLAAPGVAAGAPSASTVGPSADGPPLAHGAVGADAVGAIANEDATPTPTPDPEAGDGGDADSDQPRMADQARISPTTIQEAEYLSVETVEADANFTTTGDVAFFEVSHPVEAARISQSLADATVLEGGHVVKVEYASDAAPPGSESYFELELFFEDGSQSAVDLYARETDQTVAAAELIEWEPVIDQLCDNAERWGYECDPDDALAYLDFSQNRNELVEDFLVEQASFAFAWLMTGAMHPATLTLMLASFAVISWRVYRKHGDYIGELKTRASRYRQKIDRLQIDWEKTKRTADDDELGEVAQIGSWDVFWTDAYGVRSPYQLARLANEGAYRRVQKPVETDGGEDAAGEQLQTVLVQEHNGVADLTVDSLEESWLEPVLRHLPNDRTALNHLLAAIHHMETEYQMGHLYRETRHQIEMLLDELDEQDPRTGTHRGDGPPGLPGAGDHGSSGGPGGSARSMGGPD